jgi:Leucine-rich repeat (LRR) protein
MLIKLCGPFLWLIRLVNLQELVLAHSRILSLDPASLRGLYNLVRLDLSSNLLTSVPSSALGLTTQLRELSLASNPLQGGLEAAAFLGLSELTRLDLSGCSLVQIPYRAFASLHSLEQLYLRSVLKAFMVFQVDRPAEPFI